MVGPPQSLSAARVNLVPLAVDVLVCFFLSVLHEDVALPKLTIPFLLAPLDEPRCAPVRLHGPTGATGMVLPLRTTDAEPADAVPAAVAAADETTGSSPATTPGPTTADVNPLVPYMSA